MDTPTIESDLKTRGEAIIENLREELLSIRTGRPNPGIIEELIVNTYGGTTKLRLKELASISTEPPQMLIINPFDPSTIGDIETSILSSNLNITPQTQGTIIRIVFPPLTEDQRTKMVRFVSTKVEEFKEQLRILRDESRKKIKVLVDNKTISEDEKFKAQEVIDKITKELNDTIENIKVRKSEDLMSV